MQKPEDGAEIQLLRREMKNLKHSIDLLNDRVQGLHDIEMLHVENQRLKIELQLVAIEQLLPLPPK